MNIKETERYERQGGIEKQEIKRKAEKAGRGKCRVVSSRVTIYGEKKSCKMKDGKFTNKRERPT